jgi:hypothetical protein
VPTDDDLVISWLDDPALRSVVVGEFDGGNTRRTMRVSPGASDTFVNAFSPFGARSTLELRTPT